MKMPGINIFLMMPQMTPNTDKKKSLLSDALSNKQEDQRHQDMMMKLSDMIREMRALPHTAHAGGG
jgi:hypothetical protein